MKRTRGEITLIAKEFYLDQVPHGVTGLGTQDYGGISQLLNHGLASGDDSGKKNVLTEKTVISVPYVQQYRKEMDKKRGSYSCLCDLHV
ncbi:hypothetical protein Tco_1345153 [Tanacetum coccineum]